MDNPVISTKMGKVKGKSVELRDGKKVEIFRNIPFAKPPTGQRRFMAPEPSEPWSGVLDGTKPGNAPEYMTSFDGPMEKVFPHIQFEDCPKVHDEDCLHLSVYTPYNRIGKKMAVMVWFYGGGFQTGCERLYDGTVLAGLNDVVVVIPNYRVGILGFLTLGRNSPCTGNAGLLDQQQALRWVQANIEEFGGDRNNVTIFGESAGSASVHLNVLSPTSKGLFHKAISHSGQQQLVGPFQKDTHTAMVKKALQKHFKLDCENDDNALKTLQNLPAKELIEASGALVAEKVFFSPCVDGVVLPKSSENLMKDGAFAKVPYIIGCNNTEGDGLLSMFSPVGDFFKGFTEEQARMSMMMPVTDEGFEILKKRYLREEDGATKFSQLLGRLTGYGVFLSAAVESAIAHSKAGADVYCYLGAFQLKMHHDDAYSDLLKKPEWCECDHGDDIFMTFGAPLAPYQLPKNVKFSEDEMKLSKEFMTYLTNFAKTGNPNKGNSVGLQWPKYTPEGKDLLVKSPMSTTNELDVELKKFWREEMVQYLKTD